MSPSSTAALEPQASLGREAGEQESLCPHSEEDTKAKKGYLTRPMSYSPSGMSSFNLRKGNCRVRELSPYLLLGAPGSPGRPLLHRIPLCPSGEALSKASELTRLSSRRTQWWGPLSSLTMTLNI